MSSFLVLVGVGFITFLGWFYKLLRTPAVYWSALAISVVLLLTALLSWTRPDMQHESGSLAALLLLPFLFLCCFGICRRWFLAHFSEEPEIPFRWRVWKDGERVPTSNEHVIFGLVVTLIPFVLVMLLMDFF